MNKIIKIYDNIIPEYVSDQIYELIKIECNCSEDWRRTFISIYEIFAIIVQLIGIIYFDQNASYFN